VRWLWIAVALTGACSAGRGAPAWPQSAGTVIATDWRDDGGESLAPRRRDAIAVEAQSEAAPAKSTATATEPAATEPPAAADSAPLAPAATEPPESRVVPVIDLDEIVIIGD